MSDPITRLATINSAVSDLLVNPRIRAWLSSHEPGELLRIEMALAESTDIPAADLTASHSRKAAELAGYIRALS